MFKQLMANSCNIEIVTFMGVLVTNSVSSSCSAVVALAAHTHVLFGNVPHHCVQLLFSSSEQLQNRQ